MAALWVLHQTLDEYRYQMATASRSSMARQ
jgi:hypothetical protein